MSFNPVIWFEIYVTDMTRAKRFYEGLLGITLSPLKSPAPEAPLEMWAFPGTPEQAGATGTLVHMPGCPPSGFGTMVYFGSDDCGILEKRIVPLGGSLHREKMAIGEHGFISLGVDTEGNAFGIHSMK